MVRDMSVNVRIEAFNAIGKLKMTSEYILMQTLSKKVLPITKEKTLHGQLSRNHSSLSASTGREEATLLAEDGTVLSHIYLKLLEEIKSSSAAFVCSSTIAIMAVLYVNLPKDLYFRCLWRHVLLRLQDSRVTFD